MLRSRENSELLSIGAVSARTGIAVSAIRFYEGQGLIESYRAQSGHRRFERSVIRRLSFIRICQSLGFRLEEIAESLATLPADKAPSDRQWAHMAKGFRKTLDQRIADLTVLRDKLDGCIGCGCLSLKKCALYNPDDQAAKRGPGPRYLLGDRAVEALK